MKFRCFAVSLLLLITSLSRAADSAHPNILLILCDDLGYHDVGFNGRTEWSTPTLDKLASQGATFHRWYTAAVVCAPSRAALMTGKYSIHNGVTGNASFDLPATEVTIAQALKPLGYATGLFGKWHAGPPRPGSKNFTHPMDRGFDEFFGFTNATAAWQKFPKQLWNGREQKPSEGYADTLFADHTIDFIHRHKDQPFFVYVPFIATHGLVQAPEEDIKQHLGKFKEKDPSHPLNATYAAEVTRVDKEVARILKQLDDDGLTNNTIVIFSSDHGATFEDLSKGTSNYLDSNYPFRGQKRTLWEGGMRVPGVVRWPGHVPPGTKSDEIIHNCDVFPTLLAAGAKVDESWHIDGANLLDVWQGKSKSPDRILFWEWDESGAKYLAAMHNNHKLILVGGNRAEMYDVVNDPAERRDLWAEYADERRQLESALKAWLATTSDATKQKRPAARPTTQGHPINDE
jgi:arylsulfatase A